MTTRTGMRLVGRCSPRDAWSSGRGPRGQARSRIASGRPVSEATTLRPMRPRACPAASAGPAVCSRLIIEVPDGADNGSHQDREDGDPGRSPMQALPGGRQMARPAASSERRRPGRRRTGSGAVGLEAQQDIVRVGAHRYGAAQIGVGPDQRARRSPAGRISTPGSAKRPPRACSRRCGRRSACPRRQWGQKASTSKASASPSPRASSASGFCPTAGQSTAALDRQALDDIAHRARFRDRREHAQRQQAYKIVGRDQPHEARHGGVEPEAAALILGLAPRSS